MTRNARTTAVVRCLASLALFSACALSAVADDSQSQTPAPQSRYAVTYTRDIAPILNKNCVVCHREGQVAPFALDSYAQAIRWVHQIKIMTTGRRMPPWGAVRGYGDFHDCRRLTNEQI